MDLLEPVGSGAIMERERIQQRLRDAATYPITIIQAPAGCGKTVALQHYLSTLATPHLRYDVRAEHGTLLGFVRGFADTVRGLAPGARGTVAGAVASAVTSPNPGVQLATWMSNHFSRFNGTIAIDDLHRTDADPACAQFIVALIDRTREHTRWIISSRTAPHLPLSSWLVYRATGVPITESELRFTAPEAEDAALRSRSTLTPADVSRLHETTGGWATAFTLALRVSEYSTDLQSTVAAARQLSYDYLAEHVYGLLTNDERDLLAVSALLPEIDVDVLEKAGFDRAHSMLDDLQRRVNFVSRQTDRTYRCHDLFRDFLTHQLEMLGEEANRATQVRAARALLACGRTIPALRLFIRSADIEEITRIIQDHGFMLAEQAHGDIVQTALDALPESRRASTPVIVGLRAQLEHAAGRYDEAKVLYERAIALCEDADFEALLLVKLCSTMLNLGESPIALLEPMASDERLPVTRTGELLALLAVARARFGQHEGLEVLLDRVEALAVEIDSEMARAHMLHQLGTAAVLHGDAVRADRALERAAELALSNSMYRLASLIYTSLGSNAAMNEDDLPKALRAAQHAAETAVKSGELHNARYALARQIDIEVHRGNDAAVRALLSAYLDLSGPEHPQLLKATLWARAMLAAWDSDFEAAQHLASEIGKGPLFLEERMRATAFCAVLSIAAGKREDALALVKDALHESKSGSSPRPYYARSREIVRILCAFTEALAGRITAANRLLQKKPAANTPLTAALLAYVSTIVRGLQTGSLNDADGDAHLATMNEYWHGGYARMLRAVLARYAATRQPQISLTPTELAVFRALAAGQTPKEIAAATKSSIHTVRWHIRQAVAKFGCSGREQALRSARAEGLL